jgi:hypothetical protein
MPNKKNFIKAAIKKPGSLTAMAKRAGVSITEYCGRSNLTPLAKQKCNFYKNVLKK